MNVIRCLALTLLLSGAHAADPPRPVTVTVDASKSLAPLKPVWRFFGADEPNYATMKDGRKLLAELGQIGSPQVYFRAHNLLTTGDGTPATAIDTATAGRVTSTFSTPRQMQLGLKFNF